MPFCPTFKAEENVLMAPNFNHSIAKRLLIANTVLQLTSRCSPCQKGITELSAPRQHSELRKTHSPWERVVTHRDAAWHCRTSPAPAANKEGAKSTLRQCRAQPCDPWPGLMSAPTQSGTASGSLCQEQDARA